MSLDSRITGLPVYSRLDEIRKTLSEQGLLIVSARPGAGKTTLIPWALAGGSVSSAGNSEGMILLLEPRRLAARAAADRIASLFGQEAGDWVGLRTRDESIDGKRITVVTEGVLVRMLQSDPGLSGISTVIFDEFHERGVTADLGLALAWNARQLLRPDLRLCVMSATLNLAALQKAYGNWPVMDIEGRVYPVEVEYHPPREGEKNWEGAARLAGMACADPRRKDGDVLVFLPGQKEINRTAEILSGKISGAEILPLYGALPIKAQRRVLDRPPGSLPRVVLSTNVAETSVTLPSVRAVVDTGLVRRVEYSAATGMDHWSTGPIAMDSAEQRKGRAGRVESGFCLRWWKQNEFRAPETLPQVLTSDLAPLLLETALWGARDLAGLTFVTPPPTAGVARARELLSDLGFINASGAVTPDGERAASLGLHPRLARMVLLARQEELSTAALLCALLEDGVFPAGRNQPDAEAQLEVLLRHSDEYRRVLDNAARLCRKAGGRFELSGVDSELTGFLLLNAFPDRAGRRTRSEHDGSTRWTLAGGRGAILAPGSLTGADAIVAAVLDGGETSARITLAAGINMQSLLSGHAGAVTTETALEWNGWVPVVKTRTMLGRLVLKESAGGKLERKVLMQGLAEKIAGGGMEGLPWNDKALELLARARYAATLAPQWKVPALDDEALIKTAADWLMPYAKDKGTVIDADVLLAGLENLIGWENRRRLDKDVPESLVLPSGSSRRIDYRAGDKPVLAARLQEFFGCAETPRVLGRPLLIHLLSPANRPVQVTDDLGGFWVRAYPDVKKELKGRYPRHYWPDDPLEAEPTARAKPRK